MRRRWMPLVVFLLVRPLYGFEGKVVLSDGTPIADASVSILGQPGISRTDENGLFTWSPNPPLPFEVLVILPGGQYMAPVLVEQFAGDGPVLISVEPLVQESVTVTAAVTPNIQVPPASGMNVVPLEALEARHPVRLADVLENIPGAAPLSDLHAAVPSLRGMARGRTLILIDGARVTTERRAGASATFLDPFFLEGVEVSRGPGSVAYGSDAFGGVIHARTTQVEAGSPLHVRFRGSLGAGLPEKSAGVEIARGLAEGGVVLQARYRDFDEYDSPEGEVFNSAATDYGALFRLTHEAGRGMLSVGLQSDFARDVGRPDTRSRTTRTSYPVEDSHRLTISYNADPRWGFNRIDLHGFFGFDNLVTDREEMPTSSRARNIQRSDVKAKDFSFRGLGVRHLGEARIEVGVDVNGRFGLEALSSVLQYDLQDNLVSTSEEPAIEEANRTDVAAYASTEVSLAKRLTGSAGVRLDGVTTHNHGGYFEDHSTANSDFSGFASARIDMSPGLSLTGQVSRGFRDPSLSDRYYYGISGRGVATGNPDLVPETSLQYDAALRYVRRGFRFGAFAYHYQIDDLIERYDAGRDQFFFRNRGRARLRGLELEAQGEIGRAFTWEVGAQTATGVALDDGAPLDEVPPENLTVQLRRDIAETAYVQVRAAFYARDEDPGPTEAATPAYGLLDLGGGWKLGRHLHLRCLARNLFDKAYPVSPDARAVLAPGRNVVVSLEAEF